MPSSVLSASASASLASQPKSAVAAPQFQFSGLRPCCLKLDKDRSESCLFQRIQSHLTLPSTRKSSYRAVVSMAGSGKEVLMDIADVQNPLIGETTCGSLLHQLQKIWDEVGESDDERDKMLLRLEQECLDVYRRHVDQAAKSRAQLLQTLADARSELSQLVLALGEKSYNGLFEALELFEMHLNGQERVIQELEQSMSGVMRNSLRERKSRLEVKDIALG